MPYCPKCDMEFIEGITVCSDCGGPLAESKEAYDRVLAAKTPMANRPGKPAADIPEGLADQAFFFQEPDGDDAQSPDAPGGDTLRPLPKVLRLEAPYVKKSQKQEDLKSSASAFFFVGLVLLIFAALAWLKIISIPMEEFSKDLIQIVVTLMGLGCLLTAFASQRAAKRLTGEIAEEEETTKRLIDWFVSTYTGEELDRMLMDETPDLSQDEKNLKRMLLIADLFTTHHDLPDPSYVDLLSEEVYERLYEQGD